MDPNIWPFELGRYLDMDTFVATVGVSVIAALAAAAIVYRFRGGLVAARVAGWVLLAGSIASILVVTLDRPIIANPMLPSASNWVPFRDILDELHNVNRSLGTINVFGNMALFVPAGLLAALLFRPTWTAFCLAPVLSISIEVVQLFIGLSADIDDIILNTVGGVVGVCIGLLIRRLLRAHTREHAGASPASAPSSQAHDLPT